MGEAIDTGDIELWTERRGQGPDVLLIAGLGDPAEAWEPQLDGLSDRYLVTAFDNRGAGRTPLPFQEVPDEFNARASRPSGARSRRGAKGHSGDQRGRPRKALWLPLFRFLVGRLQTASRCRSSRRANLAGSPPPANGVGIG
jgi:alpha-beta hydrolase superfamily lysophospholipase